MKQRDLARLGASVAVCAAGAASMYFSQGQTGIGWAILGIMLIWAREFK